MSRSIGGGGGDTDAANAGEDSAAPIVFPVAHSGSGDVPSDSVAIQMDEIAQHTEDVGMVVAGKEHAGDDQGGTSRRRRAFVFLVLVLALGLGIGLGLDGGVRVNPRSTIEQRGEH